MSLKELIRPFSWTEYSKKLHQHIQKPRSVGIFTEEDAKSTTLRLSVGTEGCIEEGNMVSFYWLVDPSDGIIVDCKYQMFGQSILLGVAEALCILIVGKNYDQAARLHMEVVEQFLRDNNDTLAFPEELSCHVELALLAIKECAQNCLDIPVAQNYVAPPTTGHLVEGNGYEGFDELSLSQKIALINQVLDTDVRPYVEMDAGGVEVIGLQNNQVTIQYEGTCTSCHSATGATLSYIQQVIRAKVDPKLEVIPNL